MKIKLISVAFISLMMFGSVFAIEPVPFTKPGNKTVPFSNEVINDSKYAGAGMLDVHYDMHAAAQKVVCVISNVNTSWVDIMRGGVLSDSTFTLQGAQTITFVGSGDGSLDTNYLYHVDPVGEFIIQTTDGSYGVAPIVSCSYENNITN